MLLDTCRRVAGWKFVVDQQQNSQQTGGVPVMFLLVSGNPKHLSGLYNQLQEFQPFASIYSQLFKKKILPTIKQLAIDSWYYLSH